MTSEIVLNPLQPEPLAESTEPQSSDNTTEANLRALSALRVRQKNLSQRDAETQSSDNNTKHTSAISAHSA